MQNPWLSVDEDEFYDESTDTYMGVFTRSPSEIAASLPRPQTPFFNSPNSKLPTINTKLAVESIISAQNDVESPVVHMRPQSFLSRQMISIF